MIGKLNDTISLSINSVKEIDFLDAKGSFFDTKTYGRSSIKVSKSISAKSSHNLDVKKSSKTVTEKTDQFGEVLAGKSITSPIIGTAYLAPEPGAKKFVEIGKKIKKGDTIMIVEAMKTMNHVPATSDGTVKEICVQDGSPVEFGQTLVILD